MDNSIAKRYNNIKLTISILKGIASFLLLLLFVWLGYSENLLLRLTEITQNNYLLFLLYILVLGTCSSVLSFPLNYYTDFYMEHKYNLSNQTFTKWIVEGLKGLAVGLVIGIPILLLFYYVLNVFQQLWWLPFAIAMFFISVVLAQILPVVILPIFYKIIPIDNEDLKARIAKMAKAVNMKLDNVYKFDMSKNTKKANAAFTGLGKTKRVILGDTLLENFSNDQIETVLAHEFGHYKRKHIVKNIFIGTVSSFVTFYLLSVFYSLSIGWFGISEITNIAALPLLALWGTLIGIIQSPITNAISRKFEYEADEYAVKTTGKKEDFISTLKQLTEQNLGDKEPHPVVEWFFYSHPSINKRIKAIEEIN